MTEIQGGIFAAEKNGLAQDDYRYLSNTIQDNAVVSDCIPVDRTSPCTGYQTHNGNGNRHCRRSGGRGRYNRIRRKRPHLWHHVRRGRPIRPRPAFKYQFFQGRDARIQRRDCPDQCRPHPLRYHYEGADRDSLGRSHNRICGQEKGKLYGCVDCDKAGSDRKADT